ncbi:hypothetical protein LTR35_002324 [Friedmanniomyces endolithicus]|uniref:Apple domain-containing protein n=1 Tax=Friedmanniomyces endolithicus TaxID=329885 RepID=A0AAN6JDQ0_9PEZI|nr:hypothetical protein LTR35_002324 [Friedmanniomyces endolithicus]KAK0295915.1 hypothetical protein LTS00_005656 [Friedmanniomyces endolithicus]KAK0325886.1 hypothetical protein LTR82_003425 [Friedmanniomyces endolithicus]KAK1005663.1 hypothetical protein LTR54_006952 [Friedmanniomyces endolithicus]
MRSFAFAGALLAGLSYALPQDGGCVTVTSEVIVPTSTATYTTTDVSTIYASTAEDLGTFTLVTRESSTTTLLTVTSTVPACTGTNNGSTRTIYTTSVATPANVVSSSSAAAGGPPGYYAKRALGLSPRQTACTTTTTFTTTYGATYTFVAAPNATSTFTDYTAFSQATVTSTQYGGTAYTIASATTTAPASSCPTGNTTTTQDARCAPSALISAYAGYGLEYASDVPGSGAAYKTATQDASSCCQLCADTQHCAATTWDVRTGNCTLEFPVEFDTGALSCGSEAALVYYDAGPDHPMAPGMGLYVAQLCGTVEFGSAPPDDGT